MVLEVHKNPDEGEFGDCRDFLLDNHVAAADSAVPNKNISSKNLLPVKIEHDDGHFIKSREAETSSFDELDHLALKDRMQRLLPKYCVEVKEEHHCDEQQLVISRNQNYEADEKLYSGMTNDAGPSCVEPQQTSPYSPSGCGSNTQRLEIQCSHNIKSEPIYEEMLGRCDEIFSDTSFKGVVDVKSEFVTVCEEVDVLDHMLFKDRMKLLAGDVNSLDIYQQSEGTSKTVPSSRKSSLASKPGRRPRKRQRSATDSIETALEEDFPGLLEALIEKGVAVNEIKLYGEVEEDDDLPSIKETFSELEDIIEKVSWRSSSFLKFCHLKSTNGEKASYCLECLLALVEQARHLRFRKWPVEWGWCRDLLSFIFVFERHNRIVLERPEYGYATYFFELTASFPIDWQIKRLVTTMKLTNCSRITLLENKPLRIGEDLSLGEARVLSEYGWVPNTGLATMLNYYDRVVHDRKTDHVRDFSEWRTKIGKLLMDGYNGGTIISSSTWDDSICDIKTVIPI